MRIVLAVVLAVSLILAPLAVEAQQQAEKVYRVGWIGSSPTATPHLQAAFRLGLSERGYAQGTPISAALKQETRTIPVVFVGNVDPVGSGFVESLARPGGNLTGFMSLEASITGKWLAMLKEIEPRLTRAALVSNPKTIPYDYFFRAGKAVAPSLGVELVPGQVENVADIERVIGSFTRIP